jgi:hypothetical protein
LAAISRPMLEDDPVVVAIEVARDRKSAIRSHAALSSSRPPSTDCSASMECGGLSAIRFGDLAARSWVGITRIDAAALRVAGNRQKKAGPGCPGACLVQTAEAARQACVRLCGRRHVDRDVDDDVGVQRDGNDVLADHLQRPSACALAASRLRNLPSSAFGDVAVGDRAEQTAVDARLSA